MRRTGISALLLSALVLLVACTDKATDVEAGDGGGTTTTTVPVTPGPANDLILQIHTGGGFVPVEHAFASVPEFTLYADGRVIVPGPTTMEFPGSALLNLLEGTVDSAAVQDAVAAARKAGVADSPAPDLGQPPVADAPTTTFVLVDGQTSTLKAYALDIGIDADFGLTTAHKENRRRLQNLVELMSKVASAATSPYEAAAVSVLVQPYTEAEAGSLPAEPAPTEADWPLASLAPGGKEQQLGGRCLGFAGADAEKVLAVAEKAKSNTRWRSGGAAFSLAFRPELPGTEPCAER